ncbi:MAG: hypothetical protein B6247_24850 [Candidatus Parabeggiatoa sp. nov. 2]|nr:MAG: hypothetical protein B6247_24850 [Beggiatoa sp. 4572_84]
MPETNELFGATICNDRLGSVTYGSSSAEDLIEQLDKDELRQRFPDFNENIDNVFIQGNFRGLPIRSAFTETGSGREGARLVFEVPSLGICEEWGDGTPNVCKTLNESGETREENKEKLKDYLKKEGSKILKELVRVSAIDPIAGNPSSQQSQIITDEFNAGTDHQYDASTSETQHNSIGFGATFGRYSLGDKNVSAYTLPLSYKMQLSPKQELIFRLPLAYTTVDGAKSYRVGVGLSYKQSVSKMWVLTPSISYGVAGSRELGTAAHSISTSLTSHFILPISSSSLSVGIGNMIAYYKTLPFRIQDYNVDMDISNTVLRNGLSLSIPLGKKMMGQELSVKTFVVDTRFLGDELFIEKYQEIGFSIGPRLKKGKANFSNNIGIGIQYLRAEGGDHAFSLNFGFEF